MERKQQKTQPCILLKRKITQPFFGEIMTICDYCKRTYLTYAEAKTCYDSHFLGKISLKSARKRYCWATFSMHKNNHCNTCTDEARKECEREENEINEDCSGLEDRNLEQT